MSVDKYLGKIYDRESYNCLHFACEVWADLTGVDITERLAAVLSPSTRVPSRKVFRGFQKIPTPSNPCLVFMFRHHTAPHIGVFVRGRVLHIHENGVEFQPIEIASRGFAGVKFYK